MSIVYVILHVLEELASISQTDGTFTVNALSGVVTLARSLDYDTTQSYSCLLYTSPSPRDATLSRMPSSA